MMQPMMQPVVMASQSSPTGANAGELIKEQLSDPISASMLEIEPDPKPSTSDPIQTTSESKSRGGSTRVIKLG